MWYLPLNRKINSRERNTFRPRAARKLLTDEYLRGAEFDYCITLCATNCSHVASRMLSRSCRSTLLWMAFHARVDLSLRRVHSHRRGRTRSSRSDKIGHPAIRRSRCWRPYRCVWTQAFVAYSWRWRWKLFVVRYNVLILYGRPFVASRNTAFSSVFA